MQYLRRLHAFTLLFAATFTSAQVHKLTDAQRDDLAGPVKSIGTVATSSGVQWQQPDGPTLVTPIWCWDCEYDPDGSKTKTGRVVDGSFIGETIRLVRDGDGRLTESFVTAATTDEIVRHDVLGPFGPTERILYDGGAVRWRQTFAYDHYGNVSDWRIFDPSGTPHGRTLMRTGKDGVNLETSTWDETGALSYQETFDPEAQMERFTSFDESGGVKVTYTVVKGKPISFWEASDAPKQFGSAFYERVDNNDVDQYVCGKDGTCERSRVHYEYLDPNKRNVSSAEWRDAEGNLRFAAYFDYEIDSHRNWTSRKVSVWSTELGKLTPLETDLRTITYW